MIEDNIKTTFDVKEEVFEETRDALNESNEQLLLSLKSPTIVKEVMKKIAFLPCGHDFTTDSNNSVNESSNKSNDCNLSTHSSPKMQLNGYTLNSDNDNEAMLAIQQLDQTIDEASPSNTNSPVIVAKIQDNFKNEQIDQQINNMNNKSNNVKPTKPPRFINYSTIENKQKTLIEINQTQCDNLIEEMYVTDENGSKSNKIIDKCITNHMKSQTLYNNDSNNRQTTHKNEIDLNYNNYNIKQMNIGVSTDLDVAIARASLSSVDSGTSSPNSTHFIVVAIDFGTTFSGYSFAFTRDADNAIHVMRKVEGCDPDASNQKIPTILLLNPDGIFHSFGFASRDHYSSLEPKEANKWFYFEKFKMDLHYNQSLSLESTINATNGNKSMSALTVFAHALRYFKLQALQELSDQSATNILIEDIRWVITVPALWKPSAKQFMRAAAYEAGIGSVDNPSQLLIALEPEAASIYCRRIKLNQLIPSCPPRECQSQSENINSNDDRLAIHWKNDSFSANDSVETSFTKGTKYIVVDVGGGTVDITCHQMQTKEGSLKELHKAIGGPNGSVGVDINFEKLLSDIFGVDFIKQFKNKRPAGYVDLMSAFEARKRSATTYQTTTSNISLPFSFINFFKKSKGMSVDSAVKKYSDGKGITYCSKLGMLRLDPTVMQQLFAPVAKQIISHIWDILNSKHVKDVTFLFLVGGFSESHILQTHIRNAFSSRLKVIIPQSPNLAILRGAVMYGLDPTVISCRRARLTYGVGVLNRFIDGKHPSHKLAIKDNIEWCADVFDKFVNCDQSIGLYESITRSYTPVNEGQSCSIIHIYCSERDDVEFITDKGVQRCGTLYLDLDDINYISHSNHINSAFKTIIKREIQTQMIFGDTEIKVCALDVMTGKCVKAEIDFLNNSNL
ncbi:heat shock 70 kDa protein 12A-like [Oppia nitens]|uniref:heat shock 70 kDa protein 12A-like n=1 Tax=Oppia nitens TaxID=1686743 RepID=UPI0023DB1336|nr:heat shock 70 kDa protein 12A-like [Oppia nitens]